MAKKHVLQVEFNPHFQVIGVFSPQKDYRMCWLLEKHLGMNMKRLADFDFPVTASTTSCPYPVFHYSQPVHFLDVYLLPNRSEETPLFREPKNLDYLLLFKKSGEPHPTEESLQAIRSIPQVQAAFVLNLTPEKKASEFFFDFEMYLARL